MLNEIADRGTSDAHSRRFGLQSDFNFSLSPEIVAVITPTDYPEILFHQGWRRWQRGTQQAAVGGNNSQCRIANRDTTGGIVVVERAIVSTTAASEIAGDMQTAVGNPNLGAPVAGSEFRDGRQVPQTGSFAEVSTGTTAAPFVASMFLLHAPAATPFEVPGGPWVLLPGTSLTIQIQVVNLLVDFCFVWRERRLQEQENVP